MRSMRPSFTPLDRDLFFGFSMMDGDVHAVDRNAGLFDQYKAFTWEPEESDEDKEHRERLNATD